MISAPVARQRAMILILCAPHSGKTGTWGRT